MPDKHTSSILLTSNQSYDYLEEVVSNSLHVKALEETEMTEMQNHMNDEVDGIFSFPSLESFAPLIDYDDDNLIWK